MKGILSLNMTRTRRLNSRVISLCLTAAILLTALIGKYLLWSSQSVPTIDEVPEFSGKPYVEINDNKPKFNEKDKKRRLNDIAIWINWVDVVRHMPKSEKS